MCSPRCCNKEVATHRFEACATLVAVLMLALLPGRSRGQEESASAPAGAHRNAPNAFLGALSFSNRRDPISVSADELEFDYRTRVLTYKGGVVVTQGDMKLESATLTVTLDEHADNRVKEVVADGQVRLSKGTRWATGGHATFDQAHNTVVLSQNAELHDGPNQVTGDRVVVYLDEERSVVEGGTGRVKALLFPSKGDVDAAQTGALP